MNHQKLIAATLTVIVVTSLSGARTGAYATYAKWGSTPVIFYINPANGDVTTTSAEAAVQVGMDAWNTQATSPFRYTYGGRVNDTTTGYDGRNVVLFRNGSNGSALATTYSWYSGSTLVDADITFWDASYRFFTGSSGCSSGAYIEDVITHELGHALGLNHSPDASATMYAAYSYCSQELRTLAADDISGAQALYGKSTSSNTAPSVSISSPTATSFLQGTSISFVGSASDSQDGSLTSRILWQSNVSGQIGIGGSLSTTLSAGTHLVTASVTDSGGLTSSRQITLTISAPVATVSPSTPRLSASGYKVKGKQRTDLSWSGISTTSVDVLRNGARVAGTGNDGGYTDLIGAKGGGSYRYKVCGSGTSSCSNEVTVSF